MEINPDYPCIRLICLNRIARIKGYSGLVMEINPDYPCIRLILFKRVICLNKIARIKRWTKFFYCLNQNFQNY